MGAFKKGQALFLYFMAYAVIGWIYEVFLEVVVYRWGFSNRGFLFGPYLPVYGFGAVIILLVLQTDCHWKNQCHTHTGVFRNRGFDNGVGTFDQLHHGMDYRGMALGL